MEEKLMTLSESWSYQRHLKSIKDSFVLLLPWFVLSTVALYLSRVQWLAHDIKEVIEVIYYVQGGSITLFILVLFSYKLFETSKTHPLLGVIASVSTYLILMLISSMFGYTTTSLYHIEHALFAILLVIFVEGVHQIVGSLWSYLFSTQQSSANIFLPYQQMLPMIVSFVLLIGLNLILMATLSMDVVSACSIILYTILSYFDSWVVIVLVNVFITLFWYVGLHGTNLLSLIVTPLSTMTLLLNAQAYANQAPLPYIFAGSINAIFGNWMTYVAMLVVMFFASKSQHLRDVVSVATKTTPFNINEPIIFGMPHIKQRGMLVAMLVCTIINVSTVYWMMYFDGLHRAFIMLPFTIPSVVQGMMATADFRVLLVWVGLLILDIIIVYPVVKKMDQMYLAQETMNQMEEAH